MEDGDGGGGGDGEGDGWKSDKEIEWVEMWRAESVSEVVGWGREEWMGRFGVCDFFLGGLRRAAERGRESYGRWCDERGE